MQGSPRRGWRTCRARPRRRLPRQSRGDAPEGHHPSHHRAGATAPSRPRADTQARPALEDGPLHPDRGVRHGPSHHQPGAAAPSRPGRAPKPVRRLRTDPSTWTGEVHHPSHHQPGVTAPSRPGPAPKPVRRLRTDPSTWTGVCGTAHPTTGQGRRRPHSPGRGTQAGPALEDGTSNPGPRTAGIATAKNAGMPGARMGDPANPALRFFAASDPHVSPRRGRPRGARPRPGRPS